jgi:hypothetical protein
MINDEGYKMISINRNWYILEWYMRKISTGNHNEIYDK